MSRHSAHLLCLLLAACTQDFGGFEFAAKGDGGGREPPPPSGRDAGEQAPGSGSGGRGGARAPDAGVDPSRPDAALASDASFEDASSPEPMDGGATDAGADAGGVDAGPPPDPAPCLEAWTAAPPGPESCADCACGMCTAPTLACLTQGSLDEQALCSDVLACAIANDCQEWDCYCSTPSCGSPGADGNGPCVAEINAAAGGGGGRARVDAIMAASDPLEPLVRANEAVRCVLGSARHATSGAVAGHCQEECL